MLTLLKRMTSGAAASLVFLCGFLAIDVGGPTLLKRKPTLSKKEVEELQGWVIVGAALGALSYTLEAAALLVHRQSRGVLSSSQ